MDLYTSVAYQNSKNLTLRYSTSFGISSTLLDASIKDHIYAIYGLVRVADEIVDTYKGSNSLQLLSELEDEVYRAIKTGFSTNLVVHAFVRTAKKFGIDRTIIHPFFKSMRIDIEPQTYDDALYKTYIHGSAEVVGLMCLRVFVKGDNARYEDLAPGAMALGSAYQKVNFLRDLAADYKELGRLYFPGVSYEMFDETSKAAILTDIQKDFARALPYIHKLPRVCKKATYLSYQYYTELVKKLEKTPASVIKERRISVPSAKKMMLLVTTMARRS